MILFDNTYPQRVVMNFQLYQLLPISKLIDSLYLSAEFCCLDAPLCYVGSQSIILDFQHNEQSGGTVILGIYDEPA